ncbi:hypothetical protein pb186bvf_000053 [Paramecium bursaria]
MQRGRSFKGPVVKIKLKKFLNLPKTRQEEEQFQSLLTSFDSNDSNQSFREFSKNLDIKTFRSYSKQSLLNTRTERSIQILNSCMDCIKFHKKIINQIYQQKKLRRFQYINQIGKKCRIILDS